MSSRQNPQGNLMASPRARRISLALSLLGIMISIYLTAYHYAGIPLACPTGGIINCENVLNSSYAYLLGVPIAVFGVAFFAVEILLLLRMRSEDALAIWNALGIGFVVYFIYLEKLVGNICIFCTAVHVIVLLLLAVTLYDMGRH